MIKKLLLTALLALPMAMMAQSEWTLPDQPKKEEPQKKSKKHAKDAAKAKKHDADAKQKAAPQLKIDRKYAAGGVPEVNGKVVWDVDIPADGMPVEVMYDKALAVINAIVSEPRQSKESRITAVNKAEHIIAAHMDEEMVFSNHTFAKDFTRFRYTLIATCHHDRLTISLNRISYAYEMQRGNGEIYTAEEWITDRQSLNKKGTNLYRLNGKFRKGTIDRKDEIVSMFQEAMRR